MREMINGKSNITTVSIRLNRSKETDQRILNTLDEIASDEQLNEKYGGKTGFIKEAILLLMETKVTDKDEEAEASNHEEKESDDKVAENPKRYYGTFLG